MRFISIGSRFSGMWNSPGRLTKLASEVLNAQKWVVRSARRNLYGSSDGFRVLRGFGGNDYVGFVAKAYKNPISWTGTSLCLVLFHSTSSPSGLTPHLMPARVRDDHYVA